MGLTSKQEQMIYEDMCRVKERNYQKSLISGAIKDAIQELKKQDDIIPKIGYNEHNNIKYKHISENGNQIEDIIRKIVKEELVKLAWIKSGHG